MSLLLLPLLIQYAPDAAWAGQPPTEYFEIQVVDEQTGRGVPMVDFS